MNNKPEIGTIVTFNSSFGSTTGKVVGYATLDPDTLQIESNGDIFAKHYGDVTAVVETPAAQDSEYQPEVGDVIEAIEYPEYGHGVVETVYEDSSFLAHVKWSNGRHINITRKTKVQLVERPTIATVAITDDSAVDNTPSEPKSNDEQPSANFIQEGDTVKFFNDNNEVVLGKVEGFTSTGQLIIRYGGGQVIRHRMGVNKVNPQPSASKTCSKCNAPMIEIEPVDEGDDAALKMWQCTKCTKIEMNYAEYFFGEPMQPSGWVADALQTVNVTSEAAANDEYLPPTVDEDNDDLPFSDLGEDENTSNENQYDSLLATLVKFAVNGKVASQRELALSLISSTQWHAMEVERELEELEGEADLFFGLGDGALDDTYAVLLDIHTANKNGALA